MSMDLILVVGATGQLGGEVIAQLIERNSCRVRALVRPGSPHAHLQLPGVEIVRGDLRDLASLEAACRGVTHVVATATVVFPRGKYSFNLDEEAGYRNLVRACVGQGVRRVAFVSLAIPFRDRYLRTSATYRSKAYVEQLLTDSGLEFAILRCAPFMDDYFALIGSRLPLAGESAATLDRARGVARLFRRLAGTTIDDWGVALVPGRPDQRHAFVAVSDVAQALIEVIRADQPRTTAEFGGPDSLSWLAICDLYSRVLKRPVRCISLPKWLLGGLTWISRPFSEALSNQLGILWILADHETGSLARSTAAPAQITAAAYLAAKMRARTP